VVGWSHFSLIKAAVFASPALWVWNMYHRIKIGAHTGVWYKFDLNGKTPTWRDNVVELIQEGKISQQKWYEKV